MNNFQDVSHLLANPASLSARFQQDGYIYLKRVVEPAKLWALRRDILNICQQQQWLKPDTEVEEGICWTVPKVEGEEDYFAAYDEIQKLEALHALAHDPAIIRIMQALLGASAFPHPLSICRLAFPDSGAWITPPHQDYPNNQGTENLYACWIPLSDCPRQQAGLEVLEGSHRLGLLPLKFALGAGHRQADLGNEAEALDWVGGDFELGDVLVFHSLTVHRSGSNSTRCLRISVDYRYQAEHEPLTAHCLQPHFQRLSWEQIYRGWQSPDLPYYWHNKSYQVVPWRSELQELPAAHFAEAVRMKREFDRQRQQLRKKYAHQPGAGKDQVTEVPE